MASKGRGARIKGKGFEIKLAQTFNKTFGLPNNGDDSFKRRWSGRAETPIGGDLKNPDWWPWPIEARNREGWDFNMIFKSHISCPMLKWWREMTEKNKTDALILAFTRNHVPNYVMFDRMELTRVLDLSVDVIDLEDVPVISLALYGLTICRLEDFLAAVKPLRSHMEGMVG